MKAIAEYFRDLASDDRYFGAEPPQPDAEMLARIAEREIERRVEARMNDGRIFLSATAPEAAQTPKRQAPVAEQAPAAQAKAPAAQETVQEPVQAPVTEAAPTPEMIPETDAVQLQDSGAVAEPVVTGPVAEAEEQIETPAEPAQVKAAAEAEDVAAEAASEVEPTIEPEAAEDLQEDVSEAEAFFADTAAGDIVEGEPQDQQEEVAEAEDVAPPARPRIVPHADSIAAKLERIRAVVSQAKEDDGDEDYDDEADVVKSAAQDDALVHAVMDDQEDAAEDAAADVIADAASDVIAALAEDDDASIYAEDEDEDLEAMLARLDDSVAQDLPLAQEDPEDGPEVAEVTVDQPEETKAVNLFDETADSDDDTAFDDDDEEIMIVDDEDADEAQSEVAAAPRLARIVKIKRADLEAAIAQGNLEEMADDEDEGDADNHQGVQPGALAARASAESDQPVRQADGQLHSTLSDEDEEALLRELEEVEAKLAGDKATPVSTLENEGEEDLQRELADIEAELAYDEPAAPVAAEADDQGQDQDQDQDRDTIVLAEDAIETARPAPAKLDAADDGDMDRLMAKADAEMGEPESARNRDAFAHLRAAVAAKNSDEKIVSAKIAEDALEVRAYQTDLADVVKPRRPEVRGTTDRRPDVTRPAPLKLVAEQRVDTMRPASEGPVRPRRVATAPAMVETAGAHSFAEFADDMGAHDLPDLLEAAAAFLAFVEERDQFSRPQVMSKVRQVIGADFSREDGLRSFGQLLRAGKIEKIEGGRFAVSGDIGFRPDQRAAG
ncbi:hypothetical protein NTA49_05270 [Photobacterium sp. TY 1-4]|uniref:Lipoprotein n=1 Tax=Pseudosulfitobacter koreensis TaxID=2968472 RepID=A0ABT1YYI8_9RHOB|nr:hypothetical protein [Pseudosulfitobacter koreense]MCR8825941.1 hypothetical protein [Pseudosulfitobacter koreense]